MQDTFSSSLSILYFVIFPLFQDYLQTVNSPAKTEITLQIDGWILTIFLELREGYPRPNFPRPLKTKSCLILGFSGFSFWGIGSALELLKCKGDSYVDQDWFWVQDELNFLSSPPILFLFYIKTIWDMHKYTSNLLCCGREKWNHVHVTYFSLREALLWCFSSAFFFLKGKKGFQKGGRC